MIAKYPAKCRYCGKPIEVGKDEYDIDSRSSYHWECHDNPKPTPEAHDFAERLGFRKHDEAMAAHRSLFLLPPAD